MFPLPDPTRLAIVGIGLAGKRHAAAIKQLNDVALMAIVDPNPDAQRDADDHGVASYNSLDDLFAATRPDGLILATPTPLHVEQGLACLAQGCPLLIEKPLANSSAKAQTLIEAADQAGIPLLVGYHRRHNPLIRKARAMIDAGMIGKLRTVHANCWFYKPDPYFDQAPWRKRKGAGPISVNMTHDIDLLRYLCGAIVSVQAQAEPSTRGFDNEDVAAALLRFENGAIGTISVSDSIVSPWNWEMTSRENPIYPATSQSCYQLGGSLASLSIPDLTLWTHNDAPDWWNPINATSSPCDQADPMIHQIAHFAAIIAGTELPLVSGRDGLASLKIIEAIQASADSGQSVAL